MTEATAHAKPADLSSTGHFPPEEDFISLRDILRMILRHRWKIATFVLLVTGAASVFLIFQPRTYQAENYLLVVPPMTQEGTVNKDLFETTVASHLQRLKSAFIAQQVSLMLKQANIDLSPLALQEKVEISRPPKLDLIRVLGSATKPELSIAIVRHWVQQYLDSTRKSNIAIALYQVRSILKPSQTEVMEKEAALERLKSQVNQTPALLTVSRTVDDTQLWKEISENIEPQKLKRLSGIHLQSQQESTAHVNLLKVAAGAEQELGAVLGKRDFFREVENYLEAQSNGSIGTATNAVPSAGASDAVRYAEVLLKSGDVIPFGEPALISAARGAARKTALAFFIALLIACSTAFLAEWLKEPQR